VTRERRRMAAMAATGEFRSPTRPSNLSPPSPGGYEFASPPLVTQSRVRVGAQVATGLSLSPSQASDLRAPVYGGVELTAPPTVRKKPPPDLPVPVPRWDTDAQRHRSSHGPPIRHFPPADRRPEALPRSPEHLSLHPRPPTSQLPSMVRS